MCWFFSSKCSFTWESPRILTVISTCSSPSYPTSHSEVRSLYKVYSRQTRTETLKAFSLGTLLECGHTLIRQVHFPCLLVSCPTSVGKLARTDHWGPSVLRKMGHFILPEQLTELEYVFLHVVSDLRSPPHSPIPSKGVSLGLGGSTLGISDPREVRCP